MITCWPSLFRPSEGRLVGDRALFERARAPHAYTAKDDVPRWAGAEFRRGYRSLDAFVRATWVVLDFDKGASRDQIAEAFGDFCGVAHSTWTPGRWRVGLLLDRPVNVEEHERVWRAAAAGAERHGLAPDFGARSAAHCFALPARHNGVAYEHVELRGALFEVTDALAMIPAPTPLPEPTAADRTDSYGQRLDRAAKYLACMPGAISGSRGHATTFKAATALVRGFGLDPDDAFRLLVEIHNPQCAPPWSERELRHKLKQAAQRARMPFGAIAERKRAA